MPCAVLIAQLALHATKISFIPAGWLTDEALMLCLYLMQFVSIVPMLRAMRADRDLGSGELKLSSVKDGV